MAILSVRHAPASAATARWSVADALQKAGLTADQAFDAALIASELVGNAVRHGRPLPAGDISVEWTLSSDSYYIAVTDGGNSSAVEPKDTDTHAISGRGLMIIAALSREWGVINNGTSTTVWARAELTSDALPGQDLHSSNHDHHSSSQGAHSSSQNLRSDGRALRSGNRNRWSSGQALQPSGFA